ncbi:MAG: radical SAM protein [Lentisphaerota bacterium]
MEQQPLKTIYFYNKNCNLRCRHCWIVPGFNTETKGEMTFPEVKDLIFQGKGLGLNGVKLLGGEPLMLPYIGELIDFLISEGLKIMFETNGTLIDDDIAGRLGNTDPFVSISLDGSNDDSHNLLRGNPGSFQKTVDGFIKLVKNNIHPQVIFCLHAGNKDDLDKMVILAKNLGASSIKINFISDMGRAQGMKSELISVKAFIDTYHAYSEKSGDDFKALFDIPPAFQSVTSLVKKENMRICGIKNIIGVFAMRQHSEPLRVGIGAHLPE